MTDEFLHRNPAVEDVRRIREVGLRGFSGEVSSEEDLLFRVRRAYDFGWQQLYQAAFGQEPDEAEEDPAQRLVASFERIWALREDPDALASAQFAAMGHWSRGETNEIELLFRGDATYFYEVRFQETVEMLCVAGNVTWGGQEPDPKQVSRMLINYMDDAFITWMMHPEYCVAEAQLGVVQIVYGSGPTPDS